MVTTADFWKRWENGDATTPKERQEAWQELDDLDTQLSKMGSLYEGAAYIVRLERTGFESSMWVSEISRNLRKKAVR